MNTDNRRARERQSPRLETRQPDLDELAATIADTGPGNDEAGREVAPASEPSPHTSQALNTVGDRTAATLEQFSNGILSNIHVLQEQLSELETFFRTDAEQTRQRIASMMANGKRVTELMQGVRESIANLQTERDDMLARHAREQR